MASSYRLTLAAQADIVAILARSHERFGEDARKRYQSLIVAAIRHAAVEGAATGKMARPELGEGVFAWHLARSRVHSPGGAVRRPRHFLVCRFDGEILVVGRVLHDAMELRRHIDARDSWD